MTTNHDRTDLPAAVPADATGTPARLDPAALTVAQLARLLGVSEQKVRKHVADGAPIGAAGTINLVHYTAWLIRRLKERDGD